MRLAMVAEDAFQRAAAMRLAWLAPAPGWDDRDAEGAGERDQASGGLGHAETGLPIRGSR